MHTPARTEYVPMGDAEVVEMGEAAQHRLEHSVRRALPPAQRLLDAVLRCPQPQADEASVRCRAVRWCAA